MTTCHKCRRTVRNLRTNRFGIQRQYDNGGEGFVLRSGVLVRQTIWLPHVCGAPLPSNPVARAAETASEPDVRAAFEFLARGK